MSRLTPENAQKRPRLARPLSSFTPAQRRLLLALIEAGRATPCARMAVRNSRDTDDPARP
jgi:hypothetical protein